MSFINRLIVSSISSILNREKSILLLGPRQVGKTTLLRHEVQSDVFYTYADPELRRRHEQHPELLIQEVKAYRSLHPNLSMPTVVIDEVQKIPAIFDSAQYCIDNKLAKFVLTGSSARKLKRNGDQINLLPGRVIEMRLDAISLLEMPNREDKLEDLLLNGSLPEVLLQTKVEHKEQLLASYVSLYLEEEVRAEAMVRNLGNFSRFLTLAAIESGNQIQLSNLAKELGISRHTVAEYFQILQDCLVTDRIDPIIDLTTRRRLSKAPRFLFFDLGIRRIAAGEGLRLPQQYYGSLFEQFIGMELLRIIRIFAPQAKLRYWRDHAGPEVDYVIEFNRQFLPIEVKWTDQPTKNDARHIIAFMKEYECVKPAYVVCQTPQAVELAEGIIAIHWREFVKVIHDYL